MGKHTYRPEIDGLRAVAVSAVLLHHAGLWAPGGYVGVDVFFVISGYLITSLLVQDIDLGKFSLASFWERRIRRILPPLVVVVLACAAAGWALLLRDDFKELGQSLVANAMLVSNVFFWRESGYFEQSAELRPLLHTWSLAVEEQFYLLFPVALMMFRRSFRRFLWPVLLGGFVLSLALSVYWSHARPETAFYMLPARAWELLLGAMLVLAPKDLFTLQRRWLVELLGATGLLMILLGIFCYDDHTRFPGLAALLPCGGTALVIAFGTRPLCGRILATPLLVGIGLISYSLYLWHWPLLVFAKHWGSTPAAVWEKLGLLLMCCILAAASWRWIEQPFRRRVVCGSRRAIFSFAATTTALVLGLGWGIHHLDGVPSRVPAAAQAYAEGKQDCLFRKEVSLRQAQDGRFISLGADGAGHPLHVLVWGDSHAMAILPVVDQLCRENGVCGRAAVHYQTPPLSSYVSHGPHSLKEETPQFSAAVLEFIRVQRVPNVILTGLWNYYINEEGGPDAVRTAMWETLTSLNALGVKVWVMHDVPRHPFDVPRRLAASVMFGRGVEGLRLPVAVHQAACSQQREILQSFAAERCVIIDPLEAFLDPDGMCRVALNGRSLYTDDNHLSTHGAGQLRRLLEGVF